MDCNDQEIRMGPKLRHTLGMVEKQNEIKAKLKRTFTKIDEGKLSLVLIVIIDKQGSVKKGIFFQILEVLEVNLSATDKDRLVKVLEDNERIPYMEAIRLLFLPPNT